MKSGRPDAPSRLVDGVTFSLYSPADIKALSVKEIVNPETFDTLNNPTPLGLYDSALGPFNRSDTCSTCKQQQPHCPGHVGHVSLPLPVYHPIFFKTLFQILKGCCLNCHHLLILPWEAAIVQGQLTLASYGLLAEAGDLASYVPEGVLETDRELESVTTVKGRVDSILDKYGYAGVAEPPAHAVSRHLVDFRRQLVTDFFKKLKVNVCPHCKAPVRKLRQEQTVRIFAKPLASSVASKWIAHGEFQKKLESIGKQPTSNGDFTPTASDPQSDVLSWKEMIENERRQLTSQVLLTQQEVLDHMRAVWDEEKFLMRRIFGALALLERNPENQACPMNAFFVDILPVAPTCFRPVCS